MPLRLCWGLIHDTHCQSTLHPPWSRNCETTTANTAKLKLRNQKLDTTTTPRCPDAAALCPRIHEYQTNPNAAAAGVVRRTEQTQYDPRQNHLMFLKHKTLGVPHNPPPPSSSGYHSLPFLFFSSVSRLPFPFSLFGCPFPHIPSLPPLSSSRSASFLFSLLFFSFLFFVLVFVVRHPSSSPPASSHQHEAVVRFIFCLSPSSSAATLIF